MYVVNFFRAMGNEMQVPTSKTQISLIEVEHFNAQNRVGELFIWNHFLDTEKETNETKIRPIETNKYLKQNLLCALKSKELFCQQ
jgi:hypothetical protein